MQEKNNLKSIFGWLVFIISVAVYAMTVQQTVPFWDCGEFSAAAVWQQVPHPPGAPLFLMLGKLFHTLIPFGDDGWRINMISAVSTAFTSMLLFHIIVMVLYNFNRDLYKDMGAQLAAYGGAFVGALAYTFSDTVWFNAVESEVYAMATLFVAVVVWLMMKWNEEADNPGHERYLMMIAYVIGLSTGVHLLAILAVFSIVYLVYFRKYETKPSTFVITGIVSLVVFAVIYPFIVKAIPALLAGHTPGRNEAMEYAIDNSTGLKVLAIGIIVSAMVGLWWSIKNNKPLVKLVTAGFILVLMGYTTYTQILIRSNANPPMNENEPKNFSKLAAYLGREQYGNDASWPRRIKNEDYFIRNYTQRDDNGNFIYGEWYSPGKKVVTRKDGSQFQVDHFDQVNVAGELTYLWKYQMYHMYFRYLGWNYVGRISDEQDAGVWAATKDEAKMFNYKSGFAHLFPINFYAIPLLFGLFGMLYHFRKDKKMAFIYMTMFLMMGVLAAIAQQQQNPQPRERDYFYTGSFLVWCLWIGMGVYGLIEMLTKEKMTQTIGLALSAVAVLLVPVNMAYGGWKYHDRTGNLIPFDYSYNILQSVEKDAILFTNGDNDTFPLWYIQDVMGVRRDVRIVNLSLGNTLWYVDQLKNQRPWGTEKIPLSFEDASIQLEDEMNDKALSYDFGEPLNLSIPVRKEILRKYTSDSAIIERGTFETVFEGKPYSQQEGKNYHLFRVQDKLVKDILVQTKWERPVYFSYTVGPDAWCGLEKFFRNEGLAKRVCPVEQSVNGGAMDLDIMEKSLMNPDNSDNFSKEPKYGFKFRNLNNSGVYYDPVAVRLMYSYRELYFDYADAVFKQTKDSKKAIQILDKMNEMISTIQFPLSFDLEYKYSELYGRLGAKEQQNKFLDMALASCNELIANPKLKSEYTEYELFGRYAGPYRIAARIYADKNDFANAIAILRKFDAQVNAYKSDVGSGSQEAMALEMNSLDIQSNIDDYEVKTFETKGDLKGALAKANELLRKYQSGGNDPRANQLSAYMMGAIQQLNEKMGNAPQIADTSKQ